MHGEMTSPPPSRKYVTTASGPYTFAACMGGGRERERENLIIVLKTYLLELTALHPTCVGYTKTWLAIWLSSPVTDTASNSKCFCLMAVAPSHDV